MAAKGTLPSADVSAESEARKAWRFSMGIYMGDAAFGPHPLNGKLAQTTGQS